MFSFYRAKAEELRANPGQWAAYESRGHCVVLAGPGSGKTKTLTIKLARMLEEDIQSPRGIACITYNNECARELEERLDALGIEPGGRVFIGTVHSFSLTQIILPYSHTAGMGLPDNFKVATQAEQKAALERAYERTVGGPDDPHRVWGLRMDRYRRTYLDREAPDFQQKDPEAARLVEAYEQELRSMGLIDFDDMTLLSVRALQAHKWLQEAILAKFPILVVDEYQDLGTALHRMVMGLCFSTGIRLFAVGDEDQSIYGFTGANPRLLKVLSERSDVETVRLKMNYRCGSSIVSASQYALGQSRDYAAREGAPEGTVFFHSLSGSYEYQARRIVKELLPIIQKNHEELNLGDIAVLYPAAFIGDAMADAAKNAGVPFVRADTNALYPRGSKLLRWVEQCASWCCGGWRDGDPRFSALVSEGERIFTETLFSDKRRATFQRELVAFLWAKKNSELILHDWLIEFRSAMIGHLVQGSATLVDELLNLDRLIERTDVNTDSADLTIGAFSGKGEAFNRLNLSTLHSAKGREYRAVILFGMDRNRLPRRNSDGRELMEGRRLFYVGFTRAKDAVHIISSKGSISPFVTELKSRLEDSAGS